MLLSRRQVLIWGAISALGTLLTVLLLVDRRYAIGSHRSAGSAASYSNTGGVADSEKTVETGLASDFDTLPGTDPYPWVYIDFGKWRRQVIVPGDAEVQRGYMAGPESAELTVVFNSSLAEVRQRTGNQEYDEKDILAGRYRLLLGIGVEYEVYLKTRDSVPGGFHTVRLRRTFGQLFTEYMGRSGNRLINIMLPYYNRHDSLSRFVERFVRLVGKEQEELVLTVVRYTDGFPPLSEVDQQLDRQRVLSTVRQANLELGGSDPRVRVVEVEGTFSRGGALMEGARAWDSTDDVILFLCDVDIVFSSKFLQRCRANTQPGRKAYFPIVFSSYNPEVVYGVVKKKTVPVLRNYERDALIHKELGYWIDFGYGMSCQYLSDFRKNSGSFFNITGWGLEDVRLYEQFVKSYVQIVRMPDKDLVHVYHKKECSKREVGKRFNSCLKSKALNEASKLEWGLWVYKNMGDTDDVEAFLKIFRGAQVPGGA